MKKIMPVKTILGIEGGRQRRIVEGMNSSMIDIFDKFYQCTPTQNNNFFKNYNKIVKYN
jgi:hypothetical protein